MQTNTETALVLHLCLMVAACCTACTNGGSSVGATNSSPDPAKLVANPAWYTTTGVWQIASGYIVATGCAPLHDVLGKSEAKVVSSADAVADAKLRIAQFAANRPRGTVAMQMQGVQTIRVTPVTNAGVVYATIMLPPAGSPERKAAADAKNAMSRKPAISP